MHTPRHAKRTRRRPARIALAAALTGALAAGALFFSHADGAAAPAADFSMAKMLTRHTVPVTHPRDDAARKRTFAGLREHDIRADAARARARRLAATAAVQPVQAPAVAVSGGSYSYAALEQLWVSAGGPASAEAQAASIALCESGGDPTNYYGRSAGDAFHGVEVQAAGLWQIKGSQPVAGDIFDPLINAENAVAKFHESGDTFAQWVCQGTTQAAGAKLLSASTTTTPKRVRALHYAETYRGCWYHYGNTGPCSRGFDCSGLVYRAYRHEGYAIPRTTYGMLGWWRLVRVWHPKRGDLAFYGSGHVELMTKFSHTTFGAHDTGTRVSFIHWSSSWHPTEYFRVRGAG